MPHITNPSPSLQDPIMQTSHSPLSLEVAPCQEDSKKDEDINFKKVKDKESFHLLKGVNLPYNMYFTSPKYDEDTTFNTSNDLIEDLEKLTMSMLSKETCQDQSIPSYSCSTSSYSLQK